MNKFTKISAAALFALFLTACDKPATKAAEAPKAESAPVAQSTPAPAQTEQVAAPVANDAQEAEDFKKIVEWNQAQEAALAQSQAALQETIATGDKAKIEESLKVFTTKVDEVLKSLDAVDVKSEAVSLFKAKTKETLTLSNDLIAESVKVMANPTAEAQKVIQDKSQVLIKAGQELQQLQQQLQQKFMPAAAAEQAPVAK